MRMQILAAEEGSHEQGLWKTKRLWNGDETDRELQFHWTIQPWFECDWGGSKQGTYVAQVVLHFPD
jgi:hypothetical protein